MNLHILELHEVLKDGYFLNLLLRIERCHDLHHLHHAITSAPAKYVDRMAVLVADFCGEKQKNSLLNQAGTYQKPVIQVKGERFDHSALKTATP